MTLWHNYVLTDKIYGNISINVQFVTRFLIIINWHNSSFPNSDIMQKVTQKQFIEMYQQLGLIELETVDQ